MQGMEHVEAVGFVSTNFDVTKDHFTSLHSLPSHRSNSAYILDRIGLLLLPPIAQRSVLQWTALSTLL